MNTNKKHKSKNKANKPLNLQTESSAIVLESEKESLVSENVQPIAIEEPKIEAISENPEKESEPRKPKRNKNKKKKTPDEELAEDALNVKETATAELIKESDKNVDIQEKSSVDGIAPTARKKNKNKQGEDLIKPPTTPAKSEIEPNVTKQEDQQGTQPATGPGDVKDDKNEQDTKPQKKKNKKKKRHDSERSEKADEVISCTAAFQMLLEVKTDKTDNVKIEESATSEQPHFQEKQMKIPSEPVQETNIEEHTSKKKNKKGKSKEENKSLESETSITSVQEKLVIPILEGKEAQKVSEEKVGPEIKEKDAIVSTKSKAKIEKPVKEKVVEKIPEETLVTVSKDKGAAASPISKSKIQEPVELKESEKIPEKTVDMEVKEREAMESLKSKSKIDKPVEEKAGAIIPEETVGMEIKEKEAMGSPKSKAKIAKPVERKQKHTKPEEHPEIKELPINVAEAVKETLKEIECDKPVSLGQILFETKAIKDIEQPKDSEKKTESSVIIPVDIAESVMKTQETKKSDKKSHSKQKKIIPENIETTPIPTEAKTTILPDDSSLNDDDNFIIPSLLDLTEGEPKKNDETPSLTTLTNIDTKNVESAVQEPNVVKMLCEVEKGESADELQVPSNKHKKRRKSPKPPPRTESVIALPDIPQQKQSDINIKSTGIEIQAKLENEPVSIPLQQIITSDEKTKQKQKESDIKLKPLEVTPDLIQYPCSISSQISDSNNNTFIQEIRASEEEKLRIPINVPDTPFAKGSGESPENPPELKTTNISISEVKTISTPESPKEKTDLKSKVMEVNQDMEDLRMSIEKSLAELTILENKENETEKRYQEKCVTSAFEAEALKVITPTPVEPKLDDSKGEIKSQELSEVPILPPPRHDKGKGKSKKKNKHDAQVAASQVAISQGASTTQTEVTSSQTTSPSTESKDDNKNNKTEQKSESSSNKSKQQSDTIETQNAASESTQIDDKNNINLYNIINKDNVKGDTMGQNPPTDSISGEFEPIESFEDAITSSLDDVNKSFEMIANDSITNDSTNNPQISVTAPEAETVKKDVKEKVNPVSQPKNLLGHPDIPVPSNRTDYKKEKNRPPNTRQAKVRIKDAVDIEPKSKQSKESQTESKNKFSKKDTTVEESVTCVTNENEEYVYKYSFRKVFLPNICHICKKELKSIKVPCNYCNLIFYCSNKHKDEGWSQHQALCFAVSTVAHHKNQKHIYADSKGLSGQAYRLFRMQLIVACEKVLKRKLVPWEQEAILYPRICANVNCREHRQDKLKDCEGCSQISYCSEDHLPKTHQKWCKSYALYQKLVYHQQTQGRLAPKLPTRVLTHETQLPDKINMVLATLYEERIDMNDLQYAALTQLATAPLTAAYSYQLYKKAMDNSKNDKSIFTIHIVNPELQYEADALNKWESLFLHLHPQINELRIVLTGTDLNPGGLPLELLGKVKLCANCRLHARKLRFSFQDARTYAEYWDSNEFLTPDIVCAFNPSIQRATIYNGKDQWPITINTIFKLKSPFLITSYTMNELNRDLNRIKECSKLDFKVVSKANFNPFASVRPDRNFITDDEIPLLFKNYCFAVLCGV